MGEGARVSNFLFTRNPNGKYFFLRWCVGGAGVNDFFYKESKLKKKNFLGGREGGR